MTREVNGKMTKMKWYTISSTWELHVRPPRKECGLNLLLSSNATLFITSHSPFPLLPCTTTTGDDGPFPNPKGEQSSPHCKQNHIREPFPERRTEQPALQTKSNMTVRKSPRSPPTSADLDTVVFVQPDYNYRRPRWLIPVVIAAVVLTCLAMILVVRVLCKLSGQNQPPPPPAEAAEVALAPQLPEELVHQEAPSASEEEY
ncbi:hypothetical protein E2542_SST21154 [Spatholobus suberectus]|nr:hypothetical protein E2542_SST21154 [Spatholobus suberectus]